MNKEVIEAGAPKRRRGRPRLNGPSRTDSATTVQALERGLNLLQLLSQSGSASLSDLSLQVGLPASTAYRMLITMQKLEFVAFNEISQEWSVGIEAFSVGSSYFNQTSLADSARSVMRELMQDTDETANLAILTNEGEVTFLTQVESTHPIRACHLPGTRSPAHSSGIGKALLAEFSRQRVEKILEKTGLQAFTPKTITTPKALFDDLQTTYIRGWSYDDEERHLGMRCIASAIHNTQGDAIAGLSISGPTARFTDETLQHLGLRLRQAAADVTRMIGGQVPDHETRRAAAQ